jgi:hypothetical protein
MPVLKSARELTEKASTDWFHLVPVSWCYRCDVDYPSCVSQKGFIKARAKNTYGSARASNRFRKHERVMDYQAHPLGLLGCTHNRRTGVAALLKPASSRQQRLLDYPH